MRKDMWFQKKMREEAEVPPLVQGRIDETLRQLTGGCEGNVWKRRFGGSLERAMCLAAACAIVAVLSIGGTAAAHLLRTYFADGRYGITPENRSTARQQGIVSDYEKGEVSDTQKGVKVECVKTVAAGKYLHLLIKTTLPDGKTQKAKERGISFREHDFRINGRENSIDMCGGMLTAKTAEKGVFYYEYLLGLNDKVYKGIAEGRDMTEEDTRVLKKQGERVMTDNPIQSWDGQTLNLTLRDLGYYGEGLNVKPWVQGTWQLSIPVRAAENKVSCETDVKLKDGARVRRLVLTPLQIFVEYDWNKQEEKITGTLHGKDGDKRITTTEYRDPRFPNRYETKDGTIKRLEEGMGRTGWNSESGLYEYDFSLEKIVDPDDIAAVWFGDERVAITDQQ